MTEDQDPPVLLVHGFASSAEHNWRHPGWLDLLADCGRETIAIDLPGHGTAPKPADPAGYQGVEAHVAAAVEGRGPLDAIGFSAGAHVLLRLAADQPGTFRRLALLGIGRIEHEIALGLGLGDVGAGLEALHLARLVAELGGAFGGRRGGPCDSAQSRGRGGEHFH